MCSRHWFFRAKMVLDGQAMPSTLFQLVKAPLVANPRNSVIGFHDNSSAIRRAAGDRLCAMAERAVPAGDCHWRTASMCGLLDCMSSTQAPPRAVGCAWSVGMHGNA